ncbi:hypothetical protein ACX12E_01245 [Paenibacillus vandeheii]
MSKSLIRKLLTLLGTLIFAVGLAFMIIEEFTPYKTMSIILMVVGIAVILISNFYREKKPGLSTASFFRFRTGCEARDRNVDRE